MLIGSGRATHGHVALQRTVAAIAGTVCAAARAEQVLEEVQQRDAQEAPQARRRSPDARATHGAVA